MCQVGIGGGFLLEAQLHTSGAIHQARHRAQAELTRLHIIPRLRLGNHHGIGEGTHVEGLDGVTHRAGAVGPEHLAIQVADALGHCHVTDALRGDRGGEALLGFQVHIETCGGDTRDAALQGARVVRGDDVVGGVNLCHDVRRSIEACQRDRGVCAVHVGVLAHHPALAAEDMRAFGDGEEVHRDGARMDAGQIVPLINLPLEAGGGDAANTHGVRLTVSAVGRAHDHDRHQAVEVAREGHALPRRVVCLPRNRDLTRFEVHFDRRSLR